MAFKSILAAGLVLGALSAPALADSASATASGPTTKTETNDPNRMICKRVETIGSRLGAKRVCRTKSEWDADQASNRQDLDRRQTLRDQSGGS